MAERGESKKDVELKTSAEMREIQKAEKPSAYYTDEDLGYKPNPMPELDDTANSTLEVE